MYHENKIMKIFNQWCNNSEETFNNEVENHAVFTRQIAGGFVAGIAAEYVLTNILESVRGSFRGPSTSSNDEKLAVINTEMQRLVAHKKGS